MRWNAEFSTLYFPTDHQLVQHPFPTDLKCYATMNHIPINLYLPGKLCSTHLCCSVLFCLCLIEHFLPHLSFIELIPLKYSFPQIKWHLENKQVQAAGKRPPKFASGSSMTCQHALRLGLPTDISVFLFIKKRKLWGLTTIKNGIGLLAWEPKKTYISEGSFYKGIRCL